MWVLLGVLCGRSGAEGTKNGAPGYESLDRVGTTESKRWDLSSGDNLLVRLVG